LWGGLQAVQAGASRFAPAAFMTQSAGINDKIANMMREVFHNRRTLVVLFLLCLMVYAQSAALLSALEPHHAGHCCLLCHVGSLPFLETAAPATVAPVVVVERLLPNPHFEASPDILLNANSSRAPPV
jgi:hypothetical protein